MADLSSLMGSIILRMEAGVPSNVSRFRPRRLIVRTTCSGGTMPGMLPAMRTKFLTRSGWEMAKRQQMLLPMELPEKWASSMHSASINMRRNSTWLW